MVARTMERVEEERRERPAEGKSPNGHRTGGVSSWSRKPTNTLYLCVLVLVSFLFAWADAEKTLYVHLGAAKTGSTYIQSMFAKRKDYLKENGMCWPGSKEGKTFKKLVETVWELRTKKDTAPLQPWIDAINTCLNKDLDVIISSERFFHYQSMDWVIPFFKNWTGRIKFIVYYREYFTRMASIYSQLNKEVIGTQTFAEYILEEFSSASYDHVSCFSDNCAMKNILQLQAAFGPKSVVIVDYDGAVAAGKDIAGVLVCDVMGKLCNEVETWKENQPMNTSPEMLPHQVLRLLDEHLRALGCQLCAGAGRAPPKLIEALVSRYNQSSLPAALPLKKTDLELVSTVSDTASQQWRAMFREVMLYDNPLAATEARQKLQMEELDLVKFYYCDSCLAWLRTELLHLYKSGKVCKCTPQAVSTIELINKH